MKDNKSLKANKSPNARPKIDKRSSLSLRPEELAVALEQAQKKSNGNFTRYIASLIERDAAGDLWEGTATNPDDGKIIQSICRVWVCAYEAKVANALKDSNQSIVFRELMTALAEFCSIWTANQVDDWTQKTVEQAGSLVVIAQSDRDALRAEILDCSKVLYGLLPAECGDRRFSNEHQKIKWVADRLNWMVTGVRCLWLLDSKDAWGRVQENQRRESYEEESRALADDF